MVLPPPTPAAWRVDTADRAGIVFAAKRYRAGAHRDASAADAAWFSRFPTWHSLFGAAELPA